MLSAIILLPLTTALMLMVIPRNFRFVMRLLTLAATLVTFILALLMLWRFETGSTEYQFLSRIPWLGPSGFSLVGVDGINVGLVFMAALVGFAAACVSWEIKHHEKEFYVLLLVMTGGIIGAFASLDLFLFYFFHELALVPTFIMIGVWGRGEQKNFATFQITLYLTLGALIALIGLIGIYLQMPPAMRTFEIPKIIAYFQTTPMSASAQRWIFPLLMFGFGILVSLWPFHTWAPLGYASAPTPTAMLHAGVLKKFGLYALIRIALPVTGEGAKHWLGVLAFLCLGNIVYCGWVAMRQRDLNFLLGNSSVAHMGFVFLGIASLSVVGVTGAVVVMITHGLLAALTFGLSGYLYQQTGTLQMDKFGGLLKQLPFIGTVMIMAMFAACGLPGFGNFVGELLVLFGAWKASAWSGPGNALHWFVVAAAWGALVIGAIYMLRAVRNIWHGEWLNQWTTLQDAGAWRKVPFVLLLTALIAIGVWPRMLTDKITPNVREIVAGAMGTKRAPAPVAALK
jgi:NADH-quinone oxidoreductase subunit M